MTKKEVTYLNPNHIVIVGIDTAATEEDTLYDERIDLDVDENLVKNIMVFGVQQPVLVRQENGEVIVVDGRQRVRAARVANQRFTEAGEVQVKVPVIAVNGDDRRVTGIMISANEQRRDDDVLVRAFKAQRMFDLVGSKSEVALAFGRTSQTINSWFRLVSADSAIHDAIRSGEISASAGINIAGMEKAEQSAEVKKLISGNKGSAATKTKSKSTRKAQPGVKRSWVKKALETEAFQKLKPRQQAALTWFATGVAEKDTWMDDFVFDVESEMESASDKKSKKTEPAPEPEAVEDTPIPDPIIPEVVTSDTDEVTPTEHSEEELEF